MPAGREIVAFLKLRGVKSLEPWTEVPALEGGDGSVGFEEGDEGVVVTAKDAGMA